MYLHQVQLVDTLVCRHPPPSCPKLNRPDPSNMYGNFRPVPGAPSLPPMSPSRTFTPMSSTAPYQTKTRHLITQATQPTTSPPSSLFPSQSASQRDKSSRRAQPSLSPIGSEASFGAWYPNTRHTATPRSINAVRPTSGSTLQTISPFLDRLVWRLQQ
jgi:hypothetical protein